MQIRRYAILLSLMVLGSAALSSLSAKGPLSIRGKVIGKDGPLEGAYVGAHAAGKTFTTYPFT